MTSKTVLVTYGHHVPHFFSRMRNLQLREWLARARMRTCHDALLSTQQQPPESVKPLDADALACTTQGFLWQDGTVSAAMDTMNEEIFQPSPAVREPYLKANLVSELATVAGISKRKTDLLLGMLAQIAYREARAGFTVPGICRLDVAHRKARRARIPRTGEAIVIGAHDMLRVRPLRKAKHAVTPMSPGLVQFVTDEPPSVKPAATDAAPSPAPGTPAPSPEKTGSAAPEIGAPAGAAVPPAAGQQNTEGLVSFRCSACGQEIEAPFDMAGTTSECPACGGSIEVPYIAEPGTIWGRALPNTPPSLPAASPAPTEEQLAATHAAMKSRTIRIELPDDL